MLISPPPITSIVSSSLSLPTAICLLPPHHGAAEDGLVLVYGAVALRLREEVGRGVAARDVGEAEGRLAEARVVVLDQHEHLKLGRVPLLVRDLQRLLGVELAGRDGHGDARPLGHDALDLLSLQALPLRLGEGLGGVGISTPKDDSAPAARRRASASPGVMRVLRSVPRAVSTKYST